MQQTEGPKHSLPAGYRIALAMSAAFMAHTLLLSGLPSPLQDSDDARHRVRVELIAPGTVTRRERSAAPEPTNSRNPRFEPFPIQNETTGPQTDSVIQATSANNRTRAQASSKNTLSTPIVEATAAANANTRSHTGEQDTLLLEPRPIAGSTRITESPNEQDPYLVELAVHLGHELEKSKVPAITQLSERVAMEIELQLLNNGALTRARVLKSTGLKRIDDAAFRASLAASPYPEPPDDDQSRFEIELVFSPNRF